MLTFVPQPQMPDHHKNGLNKAKSVISKLKQNFALIMIFSRLKIIIRKRTPSYRKNELGATEEFYPELSLFANGLRLHFKCEDESGIAYPDFFSERTIKTLMIAFSYPEEFDILAESSKNRWKIGVLSKII